MNDLATLLREEVAATEPVGALDAMVPVRLGRRRLRTHRLLSGAVAVAVLASGGVLAMPRLVDGPERDNHAVGTPDGGLPEMLDRQVRPVLERSVDDLGTYRFSADSGRGRPLTPDEYDRAHTLLLGYVDNSDHVLTVLIQERAQDVAASYAPLCPWDPDERHATHCSVLSESADGYVVERVAPDPQPFPMIPHGSVMPWHGYFAHEVVLSQGSFIIRVAESLQATDARTAWELFTVPSRDLVQIAQDPALQLDLPLRRGAAH